MMAMVFTGCSAPEVAPSTPSPPVKDPFTDAKPPDSQPERPMADREPTEADIAASIEEPPPTEADIAAAEAPSSTPAEPVELPPAEDAPLSPLVPPYTAWTTTAPLDLTGPGGATLSTLRRSGVRVEVTAQREDRVNVQCSGCEGAWRDAGGWVAIDAIFPAGRRADPATPLAPALSLRAGWAQGEGLPEGADRGTLCQLVDLGYILSGDEAIWEQNGGRMVLARDGDTWTLSELSVPEQSNWRCRVTRSDDTDKITNEAPLR